MSDPSGPPSRGERRARSPATRLVGLLLALLALLPSPRAAALHPKDGPDLDLRLQIEDDAVVLRVTLNLALADVLVDMPRVERDALRPSEEAELVDALFARLREVTRVVVDGILVTPVLAESSTYVGDADLLALFPVFGARALMQLSLVLEHPTKAPPRQVEFAWTSYPSELFERLEQDALGPRPALKALGVLVERGASERVVELSPEEPGWTWHADPSSERPTALAVPPTPSPTPPSVPAVALVLATAAALLVLRAPRTRPRVLAAGLLIATSLAVSTTAVGRIALPAAWSSPTRPDRAEAIAIFAPLHANIYRAFDYSRESDVYDALARSVTGALLDDIYDAVHRSLVMADQGGAVAHVEAVRLLETEVERLSLPDDAHTAGFVVRARWQVDGVVRHWGHSHARTHESLARYVVRAAPDGWRIAEQQILEQRRVSAAPLDASAGDGR